MQVCLQIHHRSFSSAGVFIESMNEGFQTGLPVCLISIECYKVLQVVAFLHSAFQLPSHQKNA